MSEVCKNCGGSGTELLRCDDNELMEQDCKTRVPPTSDEIETIRDAEWISTDDFGYVFKTPTKLYSAQEMYDTLFRALDDANETIKHWDMLSLIRLVEKNDKLKAQLDETNERIIELSAIDKENSGLIADYQMGEIKLMEQLDDADEHWRKDFKHVLDAKNEALVEIGVLKAQLDEANEAHRNTQKVLLSDSLRHERIDEVCEQFEKENTELETKYSNLVKKYNELVERWNREFDRVMHTWVY